MDFNYCSSSFPPNWELFVHKVEDDNDEDGKREERENRSN